jgi:hypothetical protein
VQSPRGSRAAGKGAVPRTALSHANSGAPIAVGETGQPTDVPAPTTPLLTLLGLGAMGVAAYRRRRAEGLKRLAEEQHKAAA